MPNWCKNKLEVYGKASHLRKFRDSVKSEDTQISLNKLKPLTTKTNTMASNEWGTKWDIEASLIDEHIVDGYDGYLVYEFYSAWSPPCEAILAGSKKYKNLKFCLHYDEPGMCFKGVYICKKNEVRLDNCIDWSTS